MSDRSRSLRLLLAAPLLATGLSASPALAGGDPLERLGFNALHARLGPDAPTGANVAVGFAEGQDGNGMWGPNLGLSELSGKNLTVVSPGNPGDSGHATAVMRNLCGDDSSVAPGIVDVFLWEANSWIVSFLNLGQGGNTPPDPLPGPIRVLNNSWIASSSPSTDNEVLRRIDTMINRDRILVVNGVGNNPAGNAPLNSHSFNSIAVGVSTGNHSAMATGADIDAPGRMKPEIVGVSGATSFATPQIGAIGAVLWETAETWPGLSNNLNSRRIQVIRAVLLAGATKENELDGTWSNDPETSGPDRGVTITPIDDIVGVGTGNVNASHLVFTALEQNGTADPAAAGGLPSRGWDYDTLAVGGTKYWGIEVPAGADSLSVILTWNRSVRLSTGDWVNADLELELLRRDDAGALVPMTGDAGLGYFTAGNVASRSPVDNIEHLHLEGLAAGSYVLRATRLDDGGTIPTPTPFSIAWLGPEPVAPVRPEDLDGDGAVGLSDLLIVLADFGPCGKSCPSDIDEDGTVGFGDLLAVLSAWD
jgi:hypothetical protein